MRSFEDVWAYTQAIQGWFTENEARYTYELACALPTHLCVVEIGAFRGRSTSVFGASGRTVYTVDPHDPTLGPFPFVTAEDTASLTQVIQAFPNVTWLRKRSDQIVPYDIAGQIGLVFVDGCHVHPAPRQDFERLLPALSNQAMILFHDYGHPVWPDVVRDVQTLATEGQLTICSVVDQLCVTRIAGRTLSAYDKVFSSAK